MPNQQPPKRWTESALTQEAIDTAFRSNPRISNTRAQYRGKEICLLNSMGSDGLGIIETTGPEGERIRITNLERTLIDIAVRPAYSGGPSEVLSAYGRASKTVSVKRLVELLLKMEYAYPYHQVIGFYLDRSGQYDQRQIDKFQRIPMKFNFYLAHGMGKTRFSKEWRLHYPEEL